MFTSIHTRGAQIQFSGVGSSQLFCPTMKKMLPLRKGGSQAYLVGQKSQVDFGQWGLDLGTPDLHGSNSNAWQNSILIQKNLYLSSFFSTTSRSSPTACLVMRNISAMHCNMSETYNNVSLNKDKKSDIKRKAEMYQTFPVILRIPGGCSQSVEVSTGLSVPVMQPHATEFWLSK